MENYPTLSIFMRDVLGIYGHVDDAEIFASMADNLSDAALRENLSAELPRAFADPAFSWSENLRLFHGFPQESEESARAYAEDYLWRPVFGGTPPPYVV